MGTNLPQRLKSGRKSTGLTQEQVAQRTGIDNSTISKFENGDGEPRLGQLEKFADVYHVSLSYFFDANLPSTQTVLWRSEPANSKDIEGKFLALCQQYCQLEIWTGEKPHKTLPDLDNGVGDFWYSQAQDLAREARNILGLGDRPGQRIASVLGEVYGVKIFHMDLGDTGAAACAVSDEFGVGILLNQNCTRWRRNFDVAHELFHILTWKRFKHDQQEGMCHPNSQEDKFATCFAGNLLLPTDPVKSAINKAAGESGEISYNQLDAIAREFDVSLEALFWRMHFLCKWDEDTTKRHIEKSGSLANESRVDDPRPQVLPERYKALAMQALQQGEISIGRFAKFMDISRHEAQRFLTGEESIYAKVPTPVA